MSHQQHDLASELPEFRDRIHTLKVENAHFRRLLETYNDLDQRILKIEGDGQPISDEEFEDLKKKRLALKDELVGMLRG
jgi:hypothetical protein